MSDARKTEDAAARWILRREEDDWSSAEQAQFDAWLEAAPENRVVLWRLEYGWAKADRLAALRAPPRPRPRPGPPILRLWKPTAAAASIAACIALGVALLPHAGFLTPKAAYTTDIGGRQTVPLSDGTKVELNTGTKLRTAVNTKARAVWLDQGEAYFEVAHDASRPFVVHAGPRTITVLGTKFSVRRDGDHVQVAVIEGRVKVEEAAPAQPSSPAIITRGDIVITEGASTLLAAKSVDRVANELSWRQGLLTFDRATLGDAVSEFNRYNRKKLVVTDPEAAAMRIGGSFEAENVQAFTRLLQRGFGLKIEDDGDVVKISS